MSKMNHAKLNKKKNTAKSWAENRAKSIARRKNKSLKKKHSIKKCIFVQGVAKKLRNNTPKSELWFYKYLDDSKLSGYFLKNVVVCGLIPDLHCKEHKIVIEVDGSIHNLERTKTRDARNMKRYNAAGYIVFRVEHLNEVQAVQVLKEVQNLIPKKERPEIITLPKLSEEEQLKVIAQIMSKKPKSRPLKNGPKKPTKRPSDGKSEAVNESSSPL